MLALARLPLHARIPSIHQTTGASGSEEKRGRETHLVISQSYRYASAARIFSIQTRRTKFWRAASTAEAWPWLGSDSRHRGH